MDASNKRNTIFVIIELVVCFLGITFNGVVIFTICWNIHRRISAPTYLILSIAVSDFPSCAIAIPLSIASHVQKKWPFGIGGCKAHAFLIFLLALVSITHLAAISVGKYLTITRSLTRDSYFNKKKVLLIILASWIYSFGFSVAPLVGWSRYGLEGTNVTCSVKWESSLPSDQAYFGVAKKFRRRMILSVPITRPNRVVVPRPAVLSSGISRTLALWPASINICCLTWTVSLRGPFTTYFTLARRWTKN